MDREDFLNKLIALSEGKTIDVEGFDDFENYLLSEEGIADLKTNSLLDVVMKSFPGMLSPDSITDEAKKIDYLEKIKRTAISCINRKNFLDAQSVLDLGLDFDEHDIEILLLQLIISIQMKDEVECEKYFNELINAIPVELPNDFVINVFKQSELTAKATDFFSLRADEYIKKGRVKIALKCYQYANLVNPEDKELESKINGLQHDDAFILVSDHVDKIIGIAKKLVNIPLIKSCKLMLKKGNSIIFDELYLKENRGLPAEELSFSDVYSPTVIYKVNGYTIKIEKDLNNDRLTIKLNE